MCWTLTATCAFLLALPVSAAETPSTDGFKVEPGFELLFNEKNLDGWKESSGKKESLDGKTEAYKGRFKVTEGKLVIDPALKGDVYIETTREFSKDVHLKFDFKPGAKCNNDLFLRGTKFDIVPGNKENKDVKEGQWHKAEIIVSGNTIEHKIDGQSVRKAKAGEKATPFKLRAEFGAMEIKNLRVSVPQPRLPRDNLLIYRQSDGTPAPVKSAEGWAKRRAEVIRGMESVMGKLPNDSKRCPLDPKTEEEVDCGTYVRRLITYASEPGSRVPAYLLIPKDVLSGKKKAPAILCLHGTNNVVGHGVVVGLGTTPNRGYALELAQRGYITLAPNYPLLAKYQPDLAKLGWESGTLKAVWDNMRGLDLLESLPFVDAGKLGAIGHSLGGHNSVYTAVFDDRLKVVVSSCGLDSYLDYYDGNEKNWLPEKGWCQTRYMRKLADYKGRLADIPFDFHEMIGALAPRHVLIIAPTKDSNFRADSVDRVAAAARPIFKLLGHENRLRVEHPDCGHDFPTEMRESAYKLFDAVLR